MSENSIFSSFRICDGFVWRRTWRREPQSNTTAKCAQIQHCFEIKHRTKRILQAHMSFRVIFKAANCSWIFAQRQKPVQRIPWKALSRRMQHPENRPFCPNKHVLPTEMKFPKRIKNLKTKKRKHDAVKFRLQLVSKENATHLAHGCKNYDTMNECWNVLSQEPKTETSFLPFTQTFLLSFLVIGAGYQQKIAYQICTRTQATCATSSYVSHVEMHP